MSAFGHDVRGVGLDVGLVCQGWHPDRGGVEVHTRDLARGLIERGHRVHALCLDYRDGLAPYSTSASNVDGVAVRRMAYRYQDHSKLADLVRNARADDAVMAWLAEVPCDVVHVHHATGFGAGVLRAIHEMGRPLVMTLHDYWMLCPRGQMWSAAGELRDEPEASACAECIARTWPHLMPAPDAAAAAERTKFALEMLALPQRLLAPSEAALEVFARAGVARKRMHVCEHGFDVEWIARETARIRAGLPARDRVRVGVLGSVLPSKGVLELIRALSDAPSAKLALDIHGDLPSYHGDDSYARAVREAAARDPRVVLHGPFERADLPRVLASLDAVAAPSLWNEVFGLSVREARAAGLPVLVSDRGGLASATQSGRAGLVVPATDRAAWTRALELLATDSESRVRWSSTPHALRDIAAMTRDVESHYIAAITEVTGAVPPFAAAAKEPPKSAPPKSLLRRLFGR